MPVLISNDLILDPGLADQPLNHPRIGYQSHARDATITASTTADAYLTRAPANGLTYQFWRPTELPAWWQADLGDIAEVNYIGIAAHTLGSSVCTYTLQYSADESLWLDATAGSIPANDRPIMELFSPTEARYWRLYIEGEGTMPIIGVIYIGKVLEMLRPIYAGHTPITLARQTTISTNASEAGQWLGRSIRRDGVATSASFRHLTAAWVRTELDPFIKSARLYPFFWAWRPQTYPNEIGYVWVNSDIQPSNMGIRDLMQVSFSMEGIGGYE